MGLMRKRSIAAGEPMGMALFVREKSKFMSARESKRA
jgi:hypothetical protein